MSIKSLFGFAEDSEVLEWDGLLEDDDSAVYSSYESIGILRTPDDEDDD